MTAIDFCKQQALDADPKAIELINFSRNLDQNATIFLIIEEGKLVLIFCKELYKYCKFILP